MFLKEHQAGNTNILEILLKYNKISSFDALYSVNLHIDYPNA